MSFKELDIEKCYETTGRKNDLLEKFYIPLLNNSVKYLRIAGFFSSSSLIIASKGIEGLIKNNGKMKLLISPKISEEDYEIIKENHKLSEDLALFDNFNIEDFPKNDNLEALAWMLKTGSLEIKIVVDKNLEQSLFHQKIGIAFDNEGNQISFSGSINETAQAWLNNIEEFKTFKSWEVGQVDYLLDDLKKFNGYWNNERLDIAEVYDIPNTIKNKIINIAPRDVSDLMIMRKYKEHASEEENNKLSLFPHQQRAVKKWEENEYKLLMEMATGTGKTRTAIGCFMTLKDITDKFLVVVATPQNTLSRQWKTDVDGLNIKFEKSDIIDGSNSNWKTSLEEILLDLNSGMYNNAIIYTTHDTSSSQSFTNIIKNYKRNIKILFICDEVHAIGSDVHKNALLDIYDYRIGLSATPERMFDEEGSSLIRDYFGNNSFEFTIHDALTTINPLTGKPFLNQFYYYPRFVYLNDEELAKYNDYTKRIAYLQNMENPDEEQIFTLNLNRSRILKDAIGKYDEVELIIDEINKDDKIKDTIVFVTDKQCSSVLKMLSRKNIPRAKITENESTSKIMGIHNNTEREEIIEQFRHGNLKVLVGIKCLDEGIDIKNARIAILMASSINPREYVQRVGRVIRTADNKPPSIIYDLIVKATPDNKSVDKILIKEARRTMQIACNAINYDEVLEIFKRNGVDLNGD